MNKNERVKFIQNKLQQLYQNPPVPLDHSDSYTLLIAVLLSAQCTDERVNKITPLLFEKADNPYDAAKGRGDDKSIQRVQVIKRVINTGLKYVDFYDTIASWDKYGSKDYSTDFEK